MPPFSPSYSILNVVLGIGFSVRALILVTISVGFFVFSNIRVFVLPPSSSISLCCVSKIYSSGTEISSTVYTASSKDSIVIFPSLSVTYSLTVLSSVFVILNLTFSTGSFVTASIFCISRTGFFLFSNITVFVFPHSS